MVYACVSVWWTVERSFYITIFCCKFKHYLRQNERSHLAFYCNSTWHVEARRHCEKASSAVRKWTPNIVTWKSGEVEKKRERGKEREIVKMHDEKKSAPNSKLSIFMCQEGDKEREWKRERNIFCICAAWKLCVHNLINQYQNENVPQ